MMRGLLHVDTGKKKETGEGSRSFFLQGNMGVKIVRRVETRN